MQTEIVVALITLGGSAIGTFGGILASSKLTAYRIEQLEKKVDKHNSFAERIPVLKAERDRLKAELPTLKGLFSGKRRKEIETRLAEIEKELLKLE